MVTENSKLMLERSFFLVSGHNGDSFLQQVIPYFPHLVIMWNEYRTLFIGFQRTRTGALDGLLP